MSIFLMTAIGFCIALFLIALFLAVFMLAKAKVIDNHCREALRLIGEPEKAEERLELFFFHNPSDINQACSVGSLLNPFRWSFAATFPRLHNEVKRRKEIAEL